ncbi:MAG: DUF3800 domain-containing protein [Syntrophaceae bacterium]|nr:DUF3800 domain-containing protein [Syntrophaceae bacterium]
MHICYLDESGTPEIPGTTSHYVLAGISIPINEWKKCDSAISKIKSKWNLEGKEIHTAWMLRPYLEQNRINRFNEKNYDDRRRAVESYRRAELIRLQKGTRGSYNQTKKNYLKTNDYIHLTYKERREIVKELCVLIAGWRNSRLFAECINKINYDEKKTNQTVDEQAFEQVVSRFEHYFQETSTEDINRVGILVHDNNPTVAQKLTSLMIKFHEKGTLWTEIKCIIETPFFVDSQLTCMVQIADISSYALRRYLENGENEYFDIIYKRADKKNRKVVGVRHFSGEQCECKICKSRSRQKES